MHVFFWGLKKSWLFVGLGEGTASLHDVISIVYLFERDIEVQPPWGLVQVEEISSGERSDKCDGGKTLFKEEPTALLIISHKKTTSM